MERVQRGEKNASAPGSIARERAGGRESAGEGGKGAHGDVEGGAATAELLYVL